jgi:hypothetical protein
MCGRAFVNAAGRATGDHSPMRTGNNYAVAV